MESFELLRLLDALKKIQQELDSLKNSLKPQEEEAYSSPEIKDLATALAKAQGDYIPIGLNRENPYFKAGYADLDAIMKVIRPILAKYGLSFIQQTRISFDGTMLLYSLLLHSSGQWIESRNRIIPPKNDMQTYGSTLSYNRRYAAMALLNITIGQDFSDDDAEVAMVKERNITIKGTALNTSYDPRSSSKTISKDQLDELEYELQEFPDITEMILEGLKIQTLADMPHDKFLVAVKRVREIKNIRKGK